MLTSLGELRAIETQRLADEHAAREAAFHAKRQAREAAEQAARDAHAAQLRERRETEHAAERAREADERSARLRLEAELATERARHQIELDQRRLVEEVALRREVAQRQRPRWMVATTVIAVAAALGFGGFAFVRAGDAAAALQARDRAIEDRNHAQELASASQTALDRLAQQVAEMEARIEDGIKHMNRIRTETEEREATAALERLRVRRAELEIKRRKYLDDLERIKRRTPVKLPTECMTNTICD